MRECGLELNATVGTMKLADNLGRDDEPVLWNLGARVHFARFLGVGLNDEQAEGDEIILGSVRFSF